MPQEIAHFAAILLAADPQFLHASDTEQARRRKVATEQARLLLQGATPRAGRRRSCSAPAGSRSPRRGTDSPRSGGGRSFPWFPVRP